MNQLCTVCLCCAVVLPLDGDVVPVLWVVLRRYIYPLRSAFPHDFGLSV